MKFSDEELAKLFTHLCKSAEDFGCPMDIIDTHKYRPCPFRQIKMHCGIECHNITEELWLGKLRMEESK